MTNLSVSICIPTYKRNEYLISALESIKNQTQSFINIKDIEILISDDQDNNKELENLLKKIPLKIRYIKNTNHGQYNNLNKLLVCSKSDWIIFLHDDDFLSIDYLDNIINCINNQSDSELIWTGRSLFDNNGIFGKETGKINKQSYKVPSKRFLNRMLTHNDYTFNGKVSPPMITGMCINKKLLDKVGLFDTKHDVNADGLYLWKLFYYSKKSMFINKCLFNYRVVNDSERAKPSQSGTVFKDMKSILSAIITFLKSKNYDLNYKKVWHNFYKNTLSLNGSVLWISLRYSGGYVNRIIINSKIVAECLKFDPKFILSIKTVIVLILALFPQKILYRLYEYYNKYIR